MNVTKSDEWPLEMTDEWPLEMTDEQLFQWYLAGISLEQELEGFNCLDADWEVFTDDTKFFYCHCTHGDREVELTVDADALVVGRVIVIEYTYKPAR